jgi:uncharacterized protein (DUF2141 family)
MKNIRTPFFTCMLLLVVSSLSAKGLTIIVKGITDVEGEIVVALFDSESSYNDEHNPVLSSIVSVKDTTEIIVLDSIDEGDYAVKLYQDSDSNGKLNRNIFRIPSERYGFSNNIRPATRAATFQEALFSYKSGGQIVIVIE